MKITLKTKQYTKQGYDGSVAEILYHLHSRSSEDTMLAIINDPANNIPVSAFTGRPENNKYAYELIVRCVQRGEYKLLDYLFESGVSANFVCHNGSPLILFAMQTSSNKHCPDARMFQYILEKGAKLIVDSDLVHNKLTYSETTKFGNGTVIRSLSATHCANKNPVIMNALFNVLAGPAGETVKTPETFQDFITEAAARGRTHEVEIYKARLAKLRVSEIANTTDTTTTSPVPRIVALVNAHCRDTAAFVDARKDSRPEDVNRAMLAALCHEHSQTYLCMCEVFPEYVI